MNEFGQIDSKDETCKDPVCIETISLTLYVNPTVAPFSFFRAQENEERLEWRGSGHFPGMELGIYCRCFFVLAEVEMTKHSTWLIFGHVFLCRYVSILTLVRVRTEQRGLYTALISHEDDAKEVTFDLEVQGKQVIFNYEVHAFFLPFLIKNFFHKSERQTLFSSAS